MVSDQTMFGCSCSRIVCPCKDVSVRLPTCVARPVVDDEWAFAVISFPRKAMAYPITGFFASDLHFSKLPRSALRLCPSCCDGCADGGGGDTPRNCDALAPSPLTPVAADRAGGCNRAVDLLHLQSADLSRSSFFLVSFLGIDAFAQVFILRMESSDIKWIREVASAN
jgi:hypothetical protein